MPSTSNAPTSRHYPGTVYSIALNPSRWISTKFPETFLWQPLDDPILRLLPVLGHTARDPSQLNWEWDRRGRRVTGSSSPRPWSKGSPPSFCVVPLVTFLLPSFCAPPSSASARGVCGAGNQALSSQGDYLNAPYDMPVGMKTNLNRCRCDVSTAGISLAKSTGSDID